MDFLKDVGAVAGIGGVALGVVLLLLKNYLVNALKVRGDKQAAYRLYRLFLILVWSIGVIGILAYTAVEITKSMAASRASAATPLPAPAPVVEKAPIKRRVCKAQDSTFCPPDHQTFVPCGGDFASGVADLECSKLLPPTSVYSRGGEHCGINVWEYTCIPK